MKPSTAPLAASLSAPDNSERPSSIAFNILVLSFFGRILGGGSPPGCGVGIGSGLADFP